MSAHTPGHCGHAPKCSYVGAPDERDPLGCCNCATRLADVAHDLLESLKTIRVACLCVVSDNNEVADLANIRRLLGSAVDAADRSIAKAEGKS